jgi:hypothetical protein
MIRPNSLEPFSGEIFGSTSRAREISAPDPRQLPCEDRKLGETGHLPTEQALAAAVLRQARADLRRFRNAEDRVGREMYRDAASWFLANDGEWPYSFINVCDALALSSEGVRESVFADVDLPWYSRLRRNVYALAQSIERVAPPWKRRRELNLCKHE